MARGTFRGGGGRGPLPPGAIARVCRLASTRRDQLAVEPRSARRGREAAQASADDVHKGTIRRGRRLDKGRGGGGGGRRCAVGTLSSMRIRNALAVLGAATAGATALTGLTVLGAAAASRRDLPGAVPPEPPPGLPPGRLVHVRGVGELFVREAPGPDREDAPTILLLHGWMFPADVNWFTCYEPLAEVGRVIALDHRGHGRGTRPAQPFRLTAAADDAAALLRHLGTGPVIAVGYSMGGPIAQLLWQRHPELVDGLVLCATSATFNDTPQERWQWRSIGILQLLLRLMPRAWWERGAQAQARSETKIRLSRLINEDTPEAMKALIPWVISEVDRGSAEDVAEAGRELSRFDSRGWLGSVDVPSAVVITTRDRLVPGFRQRDLAERVPDCFVREVPLDHDGVGARPDLFVPVLREAVETVHAARRAPAGATR
jgi:pimeloyl-ACP methyl ester carboxylesterase